MMVGGLMVLVVALSFAVWTLSERHEALKQRLDELEKELKKGRQ